VDTGHLLQPSIGRSEMLFTVARLDPVRAAIEVPEADSALVAAGVPAKITIAALGVTLDGKVARTSWGLDGAARTLRAEVDLPNADGKLRPGMYVNARLVAELPPAWTLPAAAVAKQADQSVVFRVIDGKAVRTLVKPGKSDGERVQVPGWQEAGETTWREWAGSERVAANAAGLSDGAAVTEK
jgi:hypothetical protein